MASLYVLNNLASRKVCQDGFDTKKAAKQTRNRLRSEGIICVVSRGADHPLGPSQVDPQCQNTEKTAKIRVRKFQDLHPADTKKSR